MISRSLKFRKLQVWDVAFDDEDEVVDLEIIVVGFPQLNHLSLSYEFRDSRAWFSKSFKVKFMVF